MKKTLIATSAVIGAQAAQDIGSGLCQALSGYDFFDLNDYDVLNRDKAAHEPASISGSNNSFQYKLCQPAWSETTDGCDDEGTAYWIEDGVCKYTFMNSKFDGVKTLDEKTGYDTTTGFSLTWTSEEACNGDEKFTFTINNVCNQGLGHDFTDFTTDGCSASASYSGREACKDYTI